MNAKGKAVIFSAPSGAGKTTIVQALLKRGLPLEFSVSACSRDPRGEEVDGKDYYFLGIDGFKQSIDRGEMMEWEEVYPDQFYGTLKTEIERIWGNDRAVIFDVDVYGGIELKKQLGNNALSVFVKPPSSQALEKRLRGRNTESEEKIQMRLKKAHEELSYQSYFDLIILNDNLENAIDFAESNIRQFLSK